MVSTNGTCNRLDVFRFSSLTLERVSKVTNVSCQYVMQLPYKERCEFVMKNKDCGADNAFIFNTFYWTFCHFTEEYSFIGLIMTAICLIMIVVATACVADGYICTNLAVISKSLRLPDSIAGVTLLALGNGIPDLFTAYAGAELGHPEILFAGLTGAGLFDVSIAAGCVIFLRPFYIDTYCWWNLFFYLCNYSILFCGFYFRNLTIWHCVAILMVYIIYGLFTIAQVTIGGFDDSDTKEEDEETLVEMARAKTFIIPEGHYSRGTLQSAVELLKNYERARIYRNMGYRVSARRSADFGYSWRHLKPLFLEFMDNINFTTKYRWRIGSPLSKMLILLLAPLHVGLKLLLPAVIPEIKANDGWSKLTVMINMLVYPCLMLLCFGLFDAKISFLPIWPIALLLGITLFILVFFFTRSHKEPTFHTAFAYAGFIGSIAVSRLLCSEVIVYLQTIAARLSVSSSWLALTVLAWGNCVTDFASAVSLSKQGLQNMGYSSLYGSPIFNCSIGITIVYIIIYIKEEPLQAFYGSMSPVGSLFLYISLVSSIILLPLLSFEGRRIMGLYLIIIYCMFLFYCILMATVIHPFGIQYKKNMQ